MERWVALRWACLPVMRAEMQYPILIGDSDFENGHWFEHLCGEPTQQARKLMLNEHR